MAMQGYVILVQGTHGLGDSWWQNGLAGELRNRGWVSPDAGEAYQWDTKLDGILGNHDAWVSAARALKWYVEAKVGMGYATVSNRRRHGIRPLAVVTHSHGGQVAALAACLDLRIDNLITITMPVRGDMDEAYMTARLNVGKWVHIHSDGSDYMQKLGMLFDGKWGGSRELKYADSNLMIPEVGHSGPLTVETWNQRNLWECLQ